MSETRDTDVIERLESHLERVDTQWQEAVKEGDEKGAAYALGKKSAFITAIEEVNEDNTEGLLNKKLKVKLECEHGGDWFVTTVTDESSTYCEDCGREVPAVIEPATPSTK